MSTDKTKQKSVKEIKHLADFLGSEIRRRYNEFQRTRVMQCWDCIEVIDELSEAYNLHWNPDKKEYEEEEKGGG